MAELRTYVRPMITVVLLGATVLGAINVYGDNGEVRQQAEKVACGEPDCAARLVRESRNPIAQTFEFQIGVTHEKRQPTATVKCQRAYFLLGDYKCE